MVLEVLEVVLELVLEVDLEVSLEVGAGGDCCGVSRDYEWIWILLDFRWFSESVVLYQWVSWQ